MTSPNNQVVNTNRDQGNRTDSIHQVPGKAKRHSLGLVQQDEERLRQELLVAKAEQEQEEGGLLVAKAQQQEEEQQVDE
jgi:hypothetical protein